MTVAVCLVPISTRPPNHSVLGGPTDTECPQIPFERLRHRIRVWRCRRRHLGSLVTARRCNRGSTTPGREVCLAARSAGARARHPGDHIVHVPPARKRIASLPTTFGKAIVSAPSERAGRSHRDPELLAVRNHPCGSDGSSGSPRREDHAFRPITAHLSKGRGDAGSEPGRHPVPTVTGSTVAGFVL